MATVTHVSPAMAVEARFRRSDGGEASCVLDRLAVDDVLAGRPVRDFRWYKGRRFYSGWYWSATAGGLVAYESRLELARIMLADFDPAVVGMAAQPFQLSGRDGSTLRRHVPDLLLRHADGGVVVVDVKPAHRVDDAAIRAVFEWTARVVGLRGWRFEVWSGAEAILLANVTFLAGYRRRHVVDEALVPAVMDRAGSRCTIADLERAVDRDPVAVRPVVLHLLWSGRLRTDLSMPIGAASIVTVAAR
jgi:hypothetical protein